MQKVEIRVKGQLDQNWSDWFNGLSITHTKSGDTVLCGSVRDQAALRGLIFNLADLGLPLVSVDTMPRVEGQYINPEEKEVTKR